MYMSLWFRYSYICIGEKDTTFLFPTFHVAQPPLSAADSPCRTTEIDTSEIDIALLQQIEKTDVAYHLFNGNEQERNPFSFYKRTTPFAVTRMRWLVHSCWWSHPSCQRKTTGLLMNLDVVGIPPAVSVLRKRSHRHIILYHCIVSYRAFVPVVRFFFPKAIPRILLTDAVS